MRTIWKFPIQPVDIQRIQMPKGAKILTIQVQREIPCLWALVDSNAPLELRMFQVIETGHTIYKEPGEYIGSYQLESGIFVFHVFSVPKEKGARE